MNFEEFQKSFQDLDPNNFGNWPIPVKTVIIIALCAAALGAGYYFDTQHQMVDLKKVEYKENELFEDFKKKQWKAATLPKLKEQLDEIEKSLGELQRRLPSEAEVAALIQDISQAAIASGLESELFEPKKEEKDKEGVYVKLPITLELSGTYHAFGKFISDVAAMPRIVTQHDVSILAGKNGERLKMKLTAQIYRYLEEQPEEKKK